MERRKFMAASAACFGLAGAKPADEKPPELAGATTMKTSDFFAELKRIQDRREGIHRMLRDLRADPLTKRTWTHGGTEYVATFETINLVSVKFCLGTAQIEATFSDSPWRRVGSFAASAAQAQSTAFFPMPSVRDGDKWMVCRVDVLEDSRATRLEPVPDSVAKYFKNRVFVRELGLAYAEAYKAAYARVVEKKQAEKDAIALFA